MTKHPSTPAAFCLLLLVAMAGPLRADETDGEKADKNPFDGEWRTSIGTVKLKQTGNDVTGTYGDQSQFTLSGNVADKTLTFEFAEGQAKGDGHWLLADSGLSFEGQFQIRGGQSGSWLGWRPDPDAPKDKWAKLTGLWLTDLGLMELKQQKGKVTGRFSLQGGSDIEGKIAGREFKFKYKAFRSGKGWFDAAEDGKTFAGAAADTGADRWFGWQGRRADEFVRHVKLEAGKIVDGSTTGLLTYSVRAPKGFKPGDDKKWPAVVVLHGSNMNGKAYVSTIAQAWPEVADDFLLIGLNGERPSDKGDDPRFNYTYVNYMGRSTYQGFPGTDRESPALVAEALDDLREAYPIERYFVGGHSQGGFLTYSLLMNFPDKIAGAFPISAGVIMQCEPTVFDDQPLREAQRAVPLAIIHGKQDPVVAFSSGQYAATIFGEAGWPAFRFFADESPAGHRFALLPVGETIRWLEAQSSDDPKRLIDFAEKRFKARGYRDVASALARAGKLAPDAAITKRLDRLAKQLDAKAKPGAAKLLPKIKAREDGKTWIDDFLTYRDDFEFAPAAHEAMEVFAALRAEHEGPAKQLLAEANVALRQGQRDEGYAKYQEIVDKYYAASSYRNVKGWLAERD